MKTFSLYRAADGVLVDQQAHVASAAHLWSAPEGHRWIEGRFDPLAVQVDLATGEPVARWSPPADDEWLEWRWSDQLSRWVSRPTERSIAISVRSDRDRRLAACDWTQARDIPAATAERWQPYRQALRDITAQPGFPHSITWPEEPT